MPAGDLTLTTDRVDDASIIQVVGELDLSTVAAFDAELEQSLPTGRVIVVLSECTFIDSSALRSLVRAQRTAREGGGGLALVAPSQPARRVIEVAALDRFMPVFETVTEAVTSSA
jgi:anti-sigma B factor antagonist